MPVISLTIITYKHNQHNGQFGFFITFAIANTVVCHAEIQGAIAKIYILFTILTTAYRDLKLIFHYSDVLNHQSHECLLNRLFRRRLKKTSKFRVTGLCDGNSPVTGEFPAQMAGNAKNVYHLMASSCFTFENSIDQTTAHHLNQCWPRSLCHMTSLGHVSLSEKGRTSSQQ